MEKLPGDIEFELRQMGLLPAPEDEKPVVERSYHFRMPVLDEHGEPPF